MKITNLNSFQNNISFSKFSNKNKAHIKEGIKDTIEISSKAKEMLEVSNSKNIKTRLNSTIHFEDSAAVLRAVERGYIKVDGKDIKLSDEDKKNLLKMDKIAEEKRLAAFYKRGLEHQIAVSRQQSAA
ncbi:hypothetical protein [Campylobacter sputorum]|uniref:hypothetical protein n=1 Tax=Campylobacter sputorum TaxID=206 RepID=UPI00053C013F|nr:hypothetical protein [Campylobacter sputorum]